MLDYKKISVALRCLENIGLWRDNAEDLGVLTWLHLTRDLDATDPRDKVFWPYGTLPFSSSNQFRVDYSVDVTTVYRDLAIAMLGFEGLSVLSFVSSPKRRSSIPLSSWVPDWTVQQHSSPFPLSSTHFHAAGDKTNSSYMISENVLKIMGMLIDKVTVLAPPLIDGDNMEGSNILALMTTGVNQWLTNTTSMAFRADQYPTGENIDTVFWKTLVCDTGPDRGVVLDEYFTHFKAFTTYISTLNSSDHSFLNYSIVNQHKHSATKFMIRFTDAAADRQFCITERGFIGWVPAGTQPGDLICIFYGGKYPYVLRPAGETYYSFIGECYVHGVMHGEALDMNDSEEKEFWLR